MFRRHRGGWSAARQAILVVVPVVLGATVLLATGDDPSTSTTRLEATQSARSLLRPDPVLEPSASQPPRTSLADALPPVTLPPAPDDPLSSNGAAPVDGAVPASPFTTAPAPAAGSAAGLGTSPAAAPAGESPTTTAAPAAVSTAALTTTSAPATQTTQTTRAAEVSTTTTTVAPAPAPAVMRSGLTRTAGVEAEIVPLTNRDRSGEGLGALTRNACLDAVASGFAEQMARSGVMAHNPGAGPAVAGCRPNPTWGDNVGTAAPCDANMLEERWMASPSHRRNILTGAFQLIGVGAWTDAQGACWVQVLFSS